jgi:hypothetical protein
MGTFIDITDKRFGRLRVIRRSNTKAGVEYLWVCLCTCGNTCLARGGGLRRGTKLSCGCLKHECAVAIAKKIGAANKTHGERGRPEYNIWNAMIQRCHNPHNLRFKDWGGRGIRVCIRWRKSYVNFIADMGYRPSRNHSIDRYPNNNGNYEPSNCRWATAKQQCETRRVASRFSQKI